MVKHRYVDIMCMAAAALAVIITAALMLAPPQLIPRASANPGYAYRLFDSGRVHRLDIRIDN